MGKQYNKRMKSVTTQGSDSPVNTYGHRVLENWGLTKDIIDRRSVAAERVKGGSGG